MASYQTLANGNIQARIRRRGKQISAVHPTKKEAVKWVKLEELSIDRAIAGKGNVSRQKFTVGDACFFYFKDHIKGKKSEYVIKCILGKIPTFLTSVRLSALERDPVQQWVDELTHVGLNPSTIKKNIGILRAAINYSIRHEIALSGLPNAIIGMKLPKELKTASRSRIASDGEIDDLAKHIGKKSKLIKNFIDLSLEIATRRGELVALEWDDIDFSNQTAFLKDTKNGTDRFAPLSGKALLIFQQIKDNSKNLTYVFPSPRDPNTHIKPASMSKAFRRVRDKLEESTGKKLDLRVHDLRHTSATNWSNKATPTGEKLDLFELQKITGHQDLRSLKRYINKDAEKVAIKMNKLK